MPRAPFLLPGIKRHPLSLLRPVLPASAIHVFTSVIPARASGPTYILSNSSTKARRTSTSYIDDEKSLLDVMQMNAIEIHAWGATVETIDIPLG